MQRRQKVMIVDDLLMHQRLIEESLGGRYDVRVASSGEEALESLPLFGPDLVLLDVSMGGIDGWETLRRLRLNNSYSHIKVVFLTSESEPSERLKGYAAGADDYIVKPFLGPELAAKVEVLLRQKRTETNLVTQLKEVEGKLVTTAKMSALGEMASGIAHELSTPLATIQLMAEQYLEDLIEQQPGTPVDVAGIQNSYRIIRSASEHIARVIDGMRMFAREGSRDTFTRCSLGELIDETLLLCGERFARNQVTLYRMFPELELECRPSQVAQILMNLFNNALDAMANEKEKSIHITCQEHGEMVEISVENSGPPIPMELRERLFEPFFTTKEVGKGTGLGLSISQNIAKAHGGYIFLCKESRNTCFRIVLPKRQRAPASS